MLLPRLSSGRIGSNGHYRQPAAGMTARCGDTSHATADSSAAWHGVTIESIASTPAASSA